MNTFALLLAAVGVLSVLPALFEIVGVEIPAVIRPLFSRAIGLSYRLSAIAVFGVLYFVGKLLWQGLVAGTGSEDRVSTALMIIGVLIAGVVIWFGLRLPKQYRPRLIPASGREFFQAGVGVLTLVGILCTSEEPIRLSDLVFLGLLFVLVIFLINPALKRLYESVGLERAGLVAGSALIILGLLWGSAKAMENALLQFTDRVPPRLAP